MWRGIRQYCKQEGLAYRRRGRRIRGLRRRVRRARGAAAAERASPRRLEPGELFRRRAFASALDAVPRLRGSCAPARRRSYLRDHSRNSISISRVDAATRPFKGLRGSSVRRDAGDGAPVDVRGVMPLTGAPWPSRRAPLARSRPRPGRARGERRPAPGGAPAAHRGLAPAAPRGRPALADGGSAARRRAPRAAPELGRRGSSRRAASRPRGRGAPPPPELSGRRRFGRRAEASRIAVRDRDLRGIGRLRQLQHAREIIHRSATARPRRASFGVRHPRPAPRREAFVMQRRASGRRDNVSSRVGLHLGATNLAPSATPSSDGVHA